MSDLESKIAARFGEIDRSWARTATDCRPSKPCYRCDTFAKRAAEITVAEGYVQRPECDKCGGWRVGCMHEGRFSPQHCADATVDCPTCGGSGLKRMVALDVDVQALRASIERFEATLRIAGESKTKDTDWELYRQDVLCLLGPARQVLAALDEGANDV